MNSHFLRPGLTALCWGDRFPLNAMASNQRSPAWKTGPHQEWYTKEVLAYGPRFTRGFVYLARLDECSLQNHVPDDRTKSDRLFALSARTKLLLADIGALHYEFGG